jgi:apolipoprotein N-acyltransferase
VRGLAQRGLSRAAPVGRDVIVATQGGYVAAVRQLQLTLERWRPLTTHGVRTFAPASPGVYGICNAHEWIYIVLVGF